MLKLLADSKLVTQSLSSTVFKFYLFQSILPVTILIQLNMQSFPHLEMLYVCIRTYVMYSFYLGLFSNILFFSLLYFIP